MSRNASDTYNRSCMLDGIIAIIKLGPYDPRIFPLDKSQHFLYPVRCDHLCIIV